MTYDLTIFDGHERDCLALVAALAAAENGDQDAADQLEDLRNRVALSTPAEES